MVIVFLIVYGVAKGVAILCVMVAVVVAVVVVVGDDLIFLSSTMRIKTYANGNAKFESFFSNILL